ncbi:MmcQ/YjbR family DNA-binding protein [Aeromicrobium panaciterrae]|uniref:MmcQ/YjbR family DNA-binding protein n=1 Tax=Aeromicrobium panaciterrae TaxID=363861 RepID=UPI0031D38086
MDTGELLARVREIALQQPLVTERLSHGGPGWFIEKSPQFAMFLDHHHGVDWVAIWIACPEGAREPLIDDDPDTYFIPPYVGTRGWVGVRLDETTDWDTVADLIDDAWHAVAKPRQRAAAD